MEEKDRLMRDGMRNAMRYIALAAVVTMVAAAAADGAELALRSESRVQKNIVLLGDIADIHAVDSQEARSLAAVELMPAPAPHGRLIIRLVELQDRLAMQGVNLADLQFSG